jgi:uncharacterized protein (DUF2384 family)
MATAVATVLDEVLEADVLDAGDVARALKASTRTIARWQAHEAVPRRASEERLLEVKAVVDLLRRHLRPESARLWIRSPNPDLGYEKPLDLMAEGQYRKVIGAILAMAEGVTA